VCVFVCNAALCHAGRQVLHVKGVCACVYVCACEFVCNAALCHAGGQVLHVRCVCVCVCM